jgi:hypothetical protein
MKARNFLFNFVPKRSTLHKSIVLKYELERTAVPRVLCMSDGVMFLNVWRAVYVTWH